MKSRWQKFISFEWLTIYRAGLLVAALAIGIMLLGYGFVHADEPFDLRAFIEELYANIASELFGIAITILIIDTIYRRYDERAEKRRERQQLRNQLGSGINEVAIRAAEELRASGWLTDGTLQGEDLRVANLEKAKLWQADLQGVNFQWAKLQGANLNDAVLAGANFTQANLTATRLRGADMRGALCTGAKMYRAHLVAAFLQDAKLTNAHLEGAKLTGAHLEGADLTGAHLDALTILPDGTPWTESTDLTRFTNSGHPDYFQPEVLISSEHDVGDE
ncbi:MAG: pentapeptide repeat-containing protein [Pleurocapsa minor GSE-CHR-MK-17-07R]|jgi:hypothetical protein|nr:pentapeptide repeat-containing protein [Pleurocapsa minor GSE-CHR-MK 17-07R]